MQELSLRDLQMLNEVQYSVEDTRRDLGRIAEYFRVQDYHNEVMKAMSEMRQIPISIEEELGMFFVDDETLISDIDEDLRAESLGFVRKNYLVYAGRVVYPVRDNRNQIMGFCGWDCAETPKYLDSRNHGYKAKHNSLFGMEKLPEYYRSGKPVYVVEGIVCCLYLRSRGLQALALLGSSATPYVIEILKRFKRLIVIPDNDVFAKTLEELNDFKPAGEHLVKIFKKKIPTATIVQSLVAKDPDDSRKAENHKYEETFVRDLINVASCPYQSFTTIRVR